ncbi:hypothetical protein H9Q73_006497 [Fusarium xylarioides]|nr:hypothetical protein H9Q73_006497 [Fusarium xylarioides]
MILLEDNKAPVPHIFAFQVDDTNPARSAFILLEFIPGNTTTEEAGGYDWSLVPRQHRPVLYQTIATAHVQIASARLPKIGAVIRQEDGSFTVGAIPGLGGPFDTAASFIEAWATKMKFPAEEDEIRRRVPLSLIDQVLEGTTSFPARLMKLARRGKHFSKEGPFPIRHADFFHSNVIVTKDYHVLGVIDWERSYTMPWELVDAPCFLTTVPRLLNPPEQYKSGRPVDQDEVENWEDEDVYATLVRDAERKACADQKLSRTLADRESRDLAALVHLYSQGKLGLYGRALDYFEKMQSTLGQDRVRLRPWPNDYITSR